MPRHVFARCQDRFQWKQKKVVRPTTDVRTQAPGVETSSFTTLGFLYFFRLNFTFRHCWCFFPGNFRLTLDWQLRIACFIFFVGWWFCWSRCCCETPTSSGFLMWVPLLQTLCLFKYIPPLLDEGPHLKSVTNLIQMIDGNEQTMSINYYSSNCQTEIRRRGIRLRDCFSCLASRNFLRFCAAIFI